MDTFPLGGFITIAILLPNLLILFFPPIFKQVNVSSPRFRFIHIMTVFERVGQIGSFTLPFFYRINCSTTLDFVSLLTIIITLSFYYVCWARYLIEGRSEELFYKSALNIPLPMAVMPVIYFISASILLGSIWLMIFAILLGVGHITVSWHTSRSGNISQ